MQNALLSIIKKTSKTIVLIFCRFTNCPLNLSETQVFCLFLRSILLRVPGRRTTGGEGKTSELLK